MVWAPIHDGDSAICNPDYDGPNATAGTDHLLEVHLEFLHAMLRETFLLCRFDMIALEVVLQDDMDSSACCSANINQLLKHTSRTRLWDL